MDKLIVGKKYYTSNESIERAKEYKKNQTTCYLDTWDGGIFVSNQGTRIDWKFWVAAEEEMGKLIVGKKYYTSDISLENAKEYKNRESNYIYTWDGDYFINKTIQTSWKFWVAAEEPTFVDSNGTPLEIGDTVTAYDIGPKSTSILRQFRGMVDGAYIVELNGDLRGCKFAVKQTQKLVKDPVSLMEQLVEDGYTVNKMGNWVKYKATTFVTGMWQYCGKSPSTYYTWEPQWLED